MGCLVNSAPAEVNRTNPPQPPAPPGGFPHHRRPRSGLLFPSPRPSPPSHRMPLMPLSPKLSRRDRRALVPVVAAFEPLEARALLSAALPSARAAAPDDGILDLPYTILPESAVIGQKAGSADRPSVVASAFNIDLVFTPSTTAAQRAVFQQAANIWESVLLGDIPDVNVSGVGTVDDVRINADVNTIDGPGGILGYAGPEQLRPQSQDFLPATGAMTFDSVDVAGLMNNGTFLPTVLHEMGHVLGIGTIWDLRGLLTGNGGNTPRFTGPAASAEYDRLSKASETSVDVESTGGSGTRYSHWRDTTYGNELMTGYLNNGSNPLSRITAASMIDLGYPDVNVDAADLYELPSSNANRDHLPSVGSLAAASGPAAGGLTLTANGVGDSDGSVSVVSFFRETNGIPGLQQGTDSPDQLLVTDTGAAGGWTATLPAGSLPAGDSTYYARANDNDGAYSAVRSVANTFSPDTVAPTVTSADFLFQQRQAVRFNFSEPVTNLSASSVTVVNQTTGQTVPGGSFVLDADSTSTSAVFRYSGGVLPDGNYLATLAAGVQDAAGNAVAGGRTESFFVLAGDANRDRRVGLDDFVLLRQNFGRSTGATFGQGDFNYDGRIGLDDFVILRRQFGMVLPPPAAPLFGDTPVGGGGSDEPLI